MALSDDCVVGWKLDEASGSTSTDVTGGGNNATVSTGSLGATGKINLGFQYPVANDGAGLLVTGLPTTGTFSVSFWYKPSSATGHYICDFETSSNRFFLIDNGKFTSNIKIVGFDSVDRDFTSLSPITNTSVFTLFVFTYNATNGNGTIYLNGSSTSQTLSFNTGLSLDFSNTTQNGFRDAYVGNHIIDEIYFFDTELSTTEIDQLYNSGNGIQYPFLPTSIKTINGLAQASVKTINGLPIASVKDFNGLT